MKVFDTRVISNLVFLVTAVIGLGLSGFLELSYSPLFIRISWSVRRISRTKKTFGFGT